MNDDTLECWNLLLGYRIDKTENGYCLTRRGKEIGTYPTLDEAKAWGQKGMDLETQLPELQKGS